MFGTCLGKYVHIASGISDTNVDPSQQSLKLCFSGAIECSEFYILAGLS